MLEIKNLNVTVEEKQILKNLNLNIGKGEVHAIMGPNGSGKSTIAHTLAGKPNYNVDSGEVNLNGEDLLSKDPYERSLNGLFLAFQYPIELPGVTNASYLKQIVNAHRKSRKETPIDAGEFLKILKEKSKLLDIPMDMHSRFVNAGFSGGEKKKNEVLQMDLLNPSLIIMNSFLNDICPSTVKYAYSVGKLLFGERFDDRSKRSERFLRLPKRLSV